MKHIILFSILVCLCCFTKCKNASESNYREIFIKYSPNDCAFCNLQIKSIHDLGVDIRKRIVLRSSDSTDDNNDEFRKEANTLGFNLSYSDSLYYKYDSSERSVLYILENDKIIFKKYLKDIQPDELKKVLLGNSKIAVDKEMGNISFPKASIARPDSAAIYLGGPYKFLLKIKKSNLSLVADTIFIDKNELREKLFKTYYGQDYKRRLDSFNAISARYNISNNFSINDFQVSKDSMWVLCMTNVIDAVDTNYTLMNASFLLHYVQNKLLDISRVDCLNPSMKNLDLYTVFPGYFLCWNSRYYFTIEKKNLIGKNYIVAEVSQQNNDIKIKSILPYELSDDLYKSKVGYFMSLITYSNGMINNAFSDIFYDIRNNKIIPLHIKHSNNDFNKEQVADLHFKIKFRVLSFWYDNDKFNVLYNSNDSLMCSQILIKNDNIISHSEKIICAPFPNDIFADGITCDANGIYSYSQQHKKIYYYPYATF